MNVSGLNIDPKENLVPESTINNSQNAMGAENEFIRKMGLSTIKSTDTSHVHRDK